MTNRLRGKKSFGAVNYYDDCLCVAEGDKLETRIATSVSWGRVLTS